MSFLFRDLLRMKELWTNDSSPTRRMNVSRVYVGQVLKGDVKITFGTALRFIYTKCLFKIWGFVFRQGCRLQLRAEG